MPQRIKERYRILEVIGQGGMGAVYKAVDTKIGGRYVAIKTIRDIPSETALKLFQQEIAILARLNHPNIVAITDTDEFEENGVKKPYLVMPFLQGRSLDRIIEQENGSLTVERSVRIIVQICQGLHAAHGERLVHGDIKPGNIILLENDWAMLIDFGVARMVDVKSSIGHRGTLLYMAPEQVDQKEATALSDIFALGVVFYEMLAKRHPFRGATLEEIAEAIRYKKPPLVSIYNSAVNDTLCCVVHKALAKDPRNRFATAKDFAESLEKALRNEPLDHFDLTKIQPRLQKAALALQKGDLLLSSDILDDIEREGYWHPELERLRKDLEQIEKQTKTRQMLENAHKYIDLAEYPLALQKLHELLELDPTHAEAIKLKLQIQDQLNELSIENWLNLARTHIANNDFQNARQAVQNVYQMAPSHPVADEISKEIAYKEEEFKRLSRIREELYQKSLEDFRAGNLSSALHKAEDLIKLGKSDKKETAKYSNHYNQVKSAYEALARKYDEAKRLLNEKSFTQAIAICNEILAQNPNNLQFQALKHESEDRQRQERSAYIAKIDREADSEQDLARKIKILEDGLGRYHDEPRFLEALKVAREKKELVNSILTKARMYEERGEFVEAISQLEILKTIYANYPSLDFEIDRLKKRRETQLQQENKARVIETIDYNLSDGSFEKALELIAVAFREFPDDPELQQLKREAEQGVEQKKRARDLLAQGRAHLQAQRYEEAMPVLEEAHALDGKDPEIKAALVESMLSSASQRISANWKEAERLLERILFIDKNNEQAKNLNLVVKDKKREEHVSRVLAQARECRSKSQLDSAAQVLREGLARYPGEPRMVKMLGAVTSSQEKARSEALVRQTESRVKDLLAEKRFKEAADLVEEILGKGSGDASLLNLRSLVHEAEQESERNKAMDSVTASIPSNAAPTDLPASDHAPPPLEGTVVSYPNPPDLLPADARRESGAEQTLLSAENPKPVSDAPIGPKNLEDTIAVPIPSAESDSPPVRKRWPVYTAVAALVSGLAVVLFIIFGRSRPPGPTYVEISVTSTPSGATVYVNDEAKGTTNTKIALPLMPREGTRTVKIKLSLAKYKDYKQDLTLELNKPAPSINVRLEEEITIPSPLADLYAKATQAFNDRKWLTPDGDNALEYANKLIEMDAQNQNGFRAKAADLKKQIKTELVNNLSQLRSGEKGTEKELDGLADIKKVDPEDSEIITRIEALTKIADNLKKQINAALSSNKFFPPEPGNAWNLMESLSTKFPARAREYLPAKKREMGSRVGAIADQKCRTLTEDCKSFLSQALVYFPTDPKLTRIKKTWEAAENKNREDLNKLLDKVSQAFARGNYVLPEEDSAAYYWKKAWELDARNRQVADWKSKIFTEGMSKADKLLYSDNRAKEAVTHYQAVRNAFPDLFNADSTPGKKLEDAQRIVKRETTPPPDTHLPRQPLIPPTQIFTYEVLHKHGFGGHCSGTLQLTGQGVRYNVTGSDKKHAFNETPYDKIGSIRRDGDAVCFSVDNANKCFKSRSGPTALKDLISKLEELKSSYKK